MIIMIIYSFQADIAWTCEIIKKKKKKGFWICCFFWKCKIFVSILWKIQFILSYKKPVCIWNALQGRIFFVIVLCNKKKSWHIYDFFQYFMHSGKTSHSNYQDSEQICWRKVYSLWKNLHILRAVFLQVSKYLMCENCI